MLYTVMQYAVTYMLKPASMQLLWIYYSTVILSQTCSKEICPFLKGEAISTREYYGQKLNQSRAMF